MKKIILILTIFAISFGCKKGEKCLIGGKWYHVKTVINGVELPNSNGTYLIFYDNKVESYNANGMLEDTHNVVITDEKIGNLQYQCKGKSLKIQYGTFNQGDVVFSDFNKNYIEYKR